MSNYVNLHATTIYSPRRSLVKIDELVYTSHQNNHNAIAVADFSNLYASTRFHKACKSKGIRPITAADVVFTRDISEKNRDMFLVTLLVKNNTGYKNLCRILTAADVDGFYYVPRVDVNILKQFSEGLICILGPESPLFNSLNQHNSETLASHYWDLFTGIYGNDLYVSIFPSQNGFNDADDYIARTYKNRLIVSNNLKYMSPADSRYYDMMDTIRRRRKFNDNNLADDKFKSFMTENDMIEYFKDHIDIVPVFDRIQSIVGECNFEFDTSYKFPNTGISNPNEKLQQMLNDSYVELSKKINKNDKQTYKDRLRYEYEVISEHGFSEYFIIIHDIIDWAKSQDIYVGPARGSIGGSLVGFCLGIHALNPIKHNLYFERFLNKDRVSMPDIDLDFEDVRREEVINHLTERYGAKHTSGIGNLGLLQLKSAMKDIAKALNIPFDQASEYTKLIPYKIGDNLVTKFSQCMQDPGFYSRYEIDQELQEVMRYANVITGTMRQPGVHAAGVVIAPDEIVNYSPLQCVDRSTGYKTTQFDMKAVESIGLIKFDILGLTTLTTIHNCINIIKSRHDVKINLDETELTHDGAYEIIASGKTSGIFQLEGMGITDMASRMKVASFEELRDLVALYRPSVLKAKQDRIYQKNKFRPRDYTPFHPLLGEILRETKGIMLFQETYMKVGVELAGFTLSEADILRKAIGKGDPKILDQVRKKWFDGCAKNGILKKDAESIFVAFEAAGSYAFNKAHSAGYALLSYRTAFLKYYYPLEFMTMQFNSEIDEHKKFNKYRSECNLFGIKMLPPDINISTEKFTIENNAIRFGLGAIKNVGMKSAKHINEIRGNQKFVSLYDFMERIDTGIVNKSCLISLAKTGCFDSMKISREDIVDNIDMLSRFYRSLHKQKTILTLKPVLKSVKVQAPYILQQWEEELIGLSF